MDKEKAEKAVGLIRELGELTKIVENCKLGIKHRRASHTVHFTAHKHYGSRGTLGTIERRHTKRILALIEEIREDVQAELDEL